MATTGAWAADEPQERPWRVLLVHSFGSSAPPFTTHSTAFEEYQQAQHSNFNEAPPEVLGTTASGTAKKANREAVIRKDGKPLVGITFPSDWNQKTGANYISAVSGDGQAYSMLVTLGGVTDKQAGIKKVKAGLENRLTEVKYQGIDGREPARDARQLARETRRDERRDSDVRTEVREAVREALQDQGIEGRGPARDARQLGRETRRDERRDSDARPEVREAVRETVRDEIR